MFEPSGATPIEPNRSHRKAASIIVGVIGGMGPEATADFLRRLIAATPAARDQDHLHVIVDCDPSVPDRSEAIISDGEDPSPYLARIARRLETAGADLLVMPCNSAHYFAQAILETVSIPLVDWPSVVAGAVINGGARRVGLLATEGTVHSRIYDSPFEAGRAIVVTPPPARQEEITRAIHAVKRGDHSEAIEFLRRALTDPVDGLPDSMLLACTELSVLFDSYKFVLDVDVYDASTIVAHHVVQRALASAV